ncbi:MAG: hypothetical protein QF535_06890, partial [Anaerolineales bacterium]|nr:hypothetical protein [Anaerolineales bacterium]
EILRGDYIHGFVQRDSYFLTYIVHYPSFYEFFGPGGFYANFTDRMADYSADTNQLGVTELVPNATAFQADNLQSLLAVDIFTANPTEPIPVLSDAEDETISSELATLYSSPTAHYQNIIFCRNDPAGSQGLGGDHTPCYISDLAGSTNCPWEITGTTELDTYLSSDISGDILFTEGYNVDITTASPVFTFNTVLGAGSGRGPDCETVTPDSPVRTLNSVRPNDVGDVYVGGDNCLMVGPDSHSSNPTDDGGLISSYRIFDGHPNDGTGLSESKLFVSGFCAQCCSCKSFENIYKALEKVAEPLWAEDNSLPADPNDGDTYEWGIDSGLLHKVNRTTLHYTCILTQYNNVFSCYEDDPITVTAAAWGHYGYLVSAQILIQNNGTTDIVEADIAIVFEFGVDLGDVTAVDNTSYANLDMANIDDSDFNPAQPLDALPN